MSYDGQSTGYTGQPTVKTPMVRRDAVDRNSPGAKLAETWRKNIRRSERYFEREWWPRARRIVRRYRDDRDNTDDTRVRRYNLLWSNVQTLGPACYSKEPKVEIYRRYDDDDPVARVACQVLERSLKFGCDTDDFNSVMVQSRDDYLLPGRGTSWIRYEPVLAQLASPQPAPELPPEQANSQPQSSSDSLSPASSDQQGSQSSEAEPPPQQLVWERAPNDYVHWSDFLHEPCAIWSEVGWGARRVLMTRPQAEVRFGAQRAAQLSYDRKIKTDVKETNRRIASVEEAGDRTEVWEIWDKVSRKAIWLSFDYEADVLDERDDPLTLENFFPFPKPLYATMTTDRLVPVPDYTLYQDQATEIDTLTARIALLQRALAVRGTYDSSNKNLAELLTERPENALIPVDNWAAFAEKGGLKGQVSFVPIDMIALVLKELVAQRALLIQDVYQITGIADIVRGASSPSETATAQRIKGSFATLRLDDKRKAIAIYARDCLRLKAEVYSSHFESSTLREMSGFDKMVEVAELAKQNPQMVEQLWEEIMKLLRSDKMRYFEMSVNVDSMVDPDRQQERQDVTQMLEAVGGYLEKALAIGGQAPELVPALGQMLLFAMRKYGGDARELEGTMERAVQQLAQRPAQGQQPNPDMIKAQADAQAVQTRAQADVDAQRRKLAYDESQLQIERDRARDVTRLAEKELILKYGIAPWTAANAILPAPDGVTNQPAQPGAVN